MALFVSADDGIDEATQEIHVGTTITPGIIRYVYKIQADGDELELIYDKCHGIPMPPSTARIRVVSWYGDHAKFIMSVWNSVNRNLNTMNNDKRDLDHCNTLIHTTFGMAWVNKDELSQCVAPPERLVDILEHKATVNLQELSHMFRTGYNALQHKCTRIGGCLIEMGFDTCCCIKDTCD